MHGTDMKLPVAASKANFEVITSVGFVSRAQFNEALTQQRVHVIVIQKTFVVIKRYHRV